MTEFDFDFKLLKINDIGKYSITRPYEAKQIVNHIINSVGLDCTKLIITDATCGVGGDSIHFSKYFLSVNSIDIVEENCNLLKANCDILAINNINIINGNYIDLYNSITQDVIYIDPPWGGMGYKNKKIIDVYLHGKDLVPLHEFINNEFTKGVDVFLKLPFNIDLSKYKIKNKLVIYNKKNKPSFYLLHLN